MLDNNLSILLQFTARSNVTLLRWTSFLILYLLPNQHDQPSTQMQPTCMTQQQQCQLQWQQQQLQWWQQLWSTPAPPTPPSNAPKIPSMDPVTTTTPRDALSTHVPPLTKTTPLKMIMTMMMIQSLTQSSHCHITTLDKFHGQLQMLHQLIKQFTLMLLAATQTMPMTMIPMTTIPLTTTLLTLMMAWTIQSNYDQLSDQPVHIPPDPPDDKLLPAEWQPCIAPTNSFSLSKSPIVSNLSHQYLDKPHNTQPHHQPLLPAKLLNIWQKPHPSSSFLLALTQTAKNNYWLP